MLPGLYENFQEIRSQTSQQYWLQGGVGTQKKTPMTPDAKLYCAAPLRLGIHAAARGHTLQKSLPLMECPSTSTDFRSSPAEYLAEALIAWSKYSGHANRRSPGSKRWPKGLPGVNASQCVEMSCLPQRCEWIFILSGYPSAGLADSWCIARSIYERVEGGLYR
jgi:hypothetical protein